MVFGCLLDNALVVVVHKLRVVVFATWNNVAYVARLYGIVAVFVHQVEGVFKVALVVECS